LHSKGAKLTAVDKNGMNAVGCAALSGQEDLLRYLIEACQLAVDTPDNDQRTPLLWAAEKGHLRAVQYLHSKGAKLTAVHKNGMNAVSCADLSGQEDLLRYLIEACQLAVDTPDNNQRTPLLWAAN